MMDIKILANTTQIPGEDIEEGSLSEIATSLDYPEPNRYRVGSFGFALTDADGTYSPENPTNFWAGVDSSKGDGIGMPISVFLVDGSHEVLLFRGNIDNLHYDAGEGLCTVRVADAMRDIFTHIPENFGVPIGDRKREFQLVQDTSSESIRGIYPIPDLYLPVAAGSIEVMSDSTTVMTEVSELRSAGPLDHNRYIVTNRGIETEVPVPDEDGYPRIKMKSAYRYQKVDTLITDILQNTGLSATNDIIIPAVHVATTFFPRGKPGYAMLNTVDISPSNRGTAPTPIPASVGAYLTDQLEDDGYIYKLLSVRRGDLVNWTVVVRVRESDGLTEVVYRKLRTAAGASEGWALAKSVGKLYVLFFESRLRTKNLSDLPDVEPMLVNTPYIEQSDVGSRTRVALDLGEYVPFLFANNGLGRTNPDDSALPEGSPKEAILPAQGINFELPDSGRGFIFHAGDLYFPYKHRTRAGEIGIARFRESDSSVAAVYTVTGSNKNLAGISFDIKTEGGTTYLAGMYNYKYSTRSRITSFRKSI